MSGLKVLVIAVIAATAACAQEAEYERARQALLAGHPDEAAEIYRHLSKADPQNANVLVNLAVAEYQAGKFDGAISSAESALRLKPGLVPARLFLGASYLQKGEFTAAIDALKRVVASDPQERNGRLMLGQALLRAGRTGEAAGELRAASAMLPTNPAVWYALGRAYESLGQQADADAAWAKLAALPPSAESHTHLAEQLDRENRWSEAAAEWRQALAMAPNDADVRLKLAWSLFRRRDYQQAMSELQHLPPGTHAPEVAFLHGASLLNLQQPDKAIPFLQQALALDSASTPARAALGQALLLTGKPEQAIPLLESASAADEDGTVHFQLFRAYQLTRQEAKAKQALDGYRRLRSSLDRDR